MNLPFIVLNTEEISCHVYSNEDILKKAFEPIKIDKNKSVLIIKDISEFNSKMGSENTVIVIDNTQSNICKNIGNNNSLKPKNISFLT